MKVARLLVLASFLAACSNPAEPGVDAGRDSGPTPDVGSETGDGGSDAGDVGIDAGPQERRGYVVAELVVPVDTSSSEDLGRDLDGDGTVDNQLGNVLSAFGMVAGSGDLDLQRSSDEMISRGEAIVLVEISAPSFVTSPAALARAVRGEMPMPLPCLDPSDVVCRRHLSGAGSFVVTTPAAPFGAGEIVAMRVEAELEEVELPLAIFEATPIWIPLAAARLAGTLSASGISAGVLTGGILEADVDAILVPGLHASVARQIEADCAGGACVKGSTGETLLGVFDEDGDGAVPLEELRASSLVTTLLRADVDLFDAAGAPGTDGTNDSLSVGVGFEAVLATFDAP